ncbi:beta-hexosaminidase subunit beta-like [Ptychodera flava]|uniref:beta-hexosaminidase subunit beta-like n=1 Tax=Ptychodera flava TaxID=63121 RepID=UPI00396A7CEF
MAFTGEILKLLTLFIFCWRLPSGRSYRDKLGTDFQWPDNVNSVIDGQREQQLLSDRRWLQSEPSKGAVWPKPQHMSTTQERIAVNVVKFSFSYTSYACDILTEAFLRYQKILFDRQCADTLNRINSANEVEQLLGLAVTLENPCDRFPAMDSNETYTLSVHSGVATLRAPSIWGAIRGLETFSQLIYQLEDDEVWVNATVITDWPRFQHRGILIDTGLHFIPTKVLLKNLDAMAYNKMNVFHWHITEDESFPYVSRAFPEMSQKGAFSPYTHVYTQEDIAMVIEYARLRGIRVVVEFDTPAHAGSWGLSHPELMTKCYSGGKPDGTLGPMDPTLDSTYQFLEKFFKEIVTVFPDGCLHMGGDEIDFDCWQSNPQITEFMKKQGYSDHYEKLEEYYFDQLLGIIDNLNHSFILWEDVWDDKVKIRQDAIIQLWLDIWRFPYKLDEITSQGYRVILSSPWYLNYVTDPYDQFWQLYYEVDPQNFEGTQEQKNLVIGGEACMWAEFVDGTNVIQRLWPSASFVAERLWSSVDTRDLENAAARVKEQRCRMVGRGLQAEPIIGPGSCLTEYNP